MAASEAPWSRRPATRRGLLALSAAIALLGAFIGIASGQAAPGTAHNPITFGIAAPSGSVYVPVTPNRVLDSRINLGITGMIHNKVAASFQVTGLHPADVATNVPAEAVGITGNLTVTQQSAQGYLALTQEPTNNPTTSTLNFPVGDNRANSVTGPLGSGGKVSVTYVAAPGATSHVLFDVTGYFVPGGGVIGPSGPPGPSGVPGSKGDTGPAGTTEIPIVSLPMGAMYEGADVAAAGPFTFRAECWSEGSGPSTIWRAGWYVKTSAAHSLVNLQNGFTLEPTDNYHVDGMIVNDLDLVTNPKWTPANLFQGVAPDGTQFSAHLWLGFNVLGSTANQCQFGGMLAH